MKSNRFTLEGNDWLKGLVMAILVPVLVIVQQSIDAGSLTFNWKVIGMAALAGLVGYIVKNFLSNSVPEAQATVAKARE